MSDSDPFEKARKDSGVLTCPFQGESLPMILRHADVRAAAKDWQTFSSDAPFRVPIPSEEDLRTMRQLPIETNPPEHKEYRKLVDPFFKRAKLPEVIEKVEQLITRLLDEAGGNNSVEIVRDFALPLQSHALTYLLDVPESEAEIWIKWGIHVFHDPNSPDEDIGLEPYLHQKFDEAKANPGLDFFSALTQASYQDRPLTRDEMMGYANLVFAGGRDTVIHTISGIIAYFAEHPATLTELRGEPKKVTHAVEEFFRVLAPITHLGRVCPEKSDVRGVTVPPNGRVSLCWSSANRDEEVFQNPHNFQLDRKPNPHVAFGFGPHLCLGAAHARLLARTLINALAQRSAKIKILEETRHVENQATYTRVNGYDSLTVSFK